MKNLDDIKFEEGKRQNAGMTVPDGFFEQFQKQLEAKIDTMEAVKPAPIVEMPMRKPSWIYRWSVAACVLVLLGTGLGIYQISHDHQILTTESNTSLAQSQIEDVQEITEMEDMMVGSVNDYDLYEYYCEL